MVEGIGKPERDGLFRSVVFAGGGCRCLWQCGFFTAIAGPMGLKPRTVAATSAGATMAATLFAGRMEYALEYMKTAVAQNRKNFYPGRLFGPKQAFPHESIYRRAILETMDEDALTRLRLGPELRVTISRAPFWAGPVLGVLAGFLCYAIEKKAKNPVHPELARKAGFRAEVHDARKCQTPGELADLLLAASCTPPVVRVQYIDGRPALDGGLVDNAPVFALDDNPGNTLVMLTRNYPVERLPRVPGRMYVQPSGPIRVYKWDYTDPEGLQEAFDLGRRDGEAFVRIYRSLGE